MAQRGTGAGGGHDPEEGPVPAMQEIYDNIWFLFLISLFIILVFYVIWGLIDLVNVPTIS